jgi:replicative DNA helicase
MTSLTNPDMEASIIGLALCEPSTLPKLMGLKAEDMCTDTHAMLWGAIRHMSGKGMVVTPSSLSAHLQSGDSVKDYLRTCIDLATYPLLAEDTAQHLRDLSMRRRIVAAAEDMAAKARNFDALSDEVLAENMGHLQQLAADGLKRGTSKREVALAAVESLKRTLPCYSSGLPSLDAVMGGGFYAGKCYGIAARKKVGKTIMLGTMSHNMACAGTKHLFIAMEMSPEEVEQRNMARAMKINSVAFLKRNDPQLPAKAAHYALHVPDNTVYEHGAGASLDDLRRMVAGHVAKSGIKGFFLDYWQLVGGMEKGQNETYHLGRVAQWVADVCRKEGVFAVVAAQLNQEGNTRGGEGLKLACDMYFALHREKDEDGAWLEMEESRYTMYTNVGSEHAPGLLLQKYGPYFEDAMPAYVHERAAE